MMEADLIIDSAETRIKRMEVVQDAYIEEVTSLKENVKQLQLGEYPVMLKVSHSTDQYSSPRPIYQGGSSCQESDRFRQRVQGNV